MTSFPETLAIAICDCWWEVCELPKCWTNTPEVERVTFRTIAAKALEAARIGERSEEQIARVLCLGFWAGAMVPRMWLGLGESQKEVFRICARHVLAVAEGAKAVRQATATA